MPQSGVQHRDGLLVKSSGLRSEAMKHRRFENYAEYINSIFNVNSLIYKPTTIIGQMLKDSIESDPVASTLIDVSLPGLNQFTDLTQLTKNTIENYMNVGVVRDINPRAALKGTITTNPSGNYLGENKETRMGALSNYFYASQLYQGSLINGDRNTEGHKYLTPELYYVYGNNPANFGHLRDMFKVSDETGRVREETASLAQIHEDLNVFGANGSTTVSMNEEVRPDFQFTYFPTTENNLQTYLSVWDSDNLKYLNLSHQSVNNAIGVNSFKYKKAMSRYIYDELDNANEGKTRNLEYDSSAQFEYYLSMNEGASVVGSPLINKTNKLMNEHKIGTMIGRFCDGQDYETISHTIDTAWSDVFGHSHGRNLLRKDAYTNTPDVHGYRNPYCRVWTYHHQYDSYRDLIRPFTDDNGDYATLEEIQTNDQILKYRSNFKREGVDDGGTYLAKNSVLIDKTNLVKIAPTIEDFPEKKVNEEAVRRCMFSIENLAWKDNANTSNLSIDQIGPNGGRIMWFPPYDLDFQENVRANWNGNTFIGRGEKVYTYTDTTRTGSLSFTLLIDHPSIIEQLKDNVSESFDGVDGDILRFFAGCDIPASKPDEEEKIKEEEEPIPPIVEPETQELRFAVFFPNNYSGNSTVYEKKEDGKSAWEQKHYLDEDWADYLLCGKNVSIPEGDNTKDSDFDEEVEIITAESDMKTFYSSDVVYCGDMVKYMDGEASYVISSEVDEEGDYKFTTAEALGDEGSTVLYLKLRVGKTMKFEKTADKHYKQINRSAENENLCIGDKLVKKLGNEQVEITDKYKDGDVYIYTVDKDFEIEKDEEEGVVKNISVIKDYSKSESDVLGYEMNLEEGISDSDYTYSCESGVENYIEAKNYYGSNPKAGQFSPGVDYSAEDKEKGKVNKFYYRVDYDLRQNKLPGGVPNYSDTNGYQLNVDLTNGVKTIDGFSDCEYSFAEVMKALWETADAANNHKQAIDNIDKMREGLADKADSDTRIANLKKIFSKSDSIDEITAEGLATEQDLPNSDTLAIRRATTLREYTLNMLKLAECKGAATSTGSSTVSSDSKQSLDDKESINTKEAKGQRAAIVTIKYLKPTVEEIAEDTEVAEVTKTASSWVRKTKTTVERKDNRYENEYQFFSTLETKDPVIFRELKNKYHYFDPAFHAISPEGFNSRLTFLQQCMRQGHTVSASDKDGGGSATSPTAGNLAFGRMPVCVIKIGDFIYSRVIVDSFQIHYSNNGIQWDLNPEGAGVQPMYAKVNMNVVFIGGQSLNAPVTRLQNATSFDYYANSGVYDNRADRVKIDSDGKIIYENLYTPNKE